MNFTQYDLGSRRAGEIVEVTLQGTEANVELLDSSNVSAFKAGRQHSYFGGHFNRSPARIPIPHSGHWYVVVHLGGYGGSVRSGVSVLPGALPPARPVSNSPLASIRQAADNYSETVGDTPDEKVYDVFISHASEDKEDVVRPLARALTELGVTCWYDESELHIGDSLRRKIDAGLSRCRFGIVVLSASFFDKGWPNYELDGLVTREVASGNQIILPIWHNVTQADVMTYSPTLAGKLARRTADTSLDDIANEIAEVTRSRGKAAQRTTCPSARGPPCPSARPVPKREPVPDQGSVLRESRPRTAPEGGSGSTDRRSPMLPLSGVRLSRPRRPGRISGQGRLLLSAVLRDRGT